jgi:hypothetical protein
MKSIILFFGVGLLVGGGLVGFFGKRYLEKTILHTSMVSAGHSYSVARDLRAGDTNAALETLEQSMDGEAVVLWSFLSEVSPSRRDAAALRTLSRLRDYRVKYSIVDDNAESEAVISNAFLILPPVLSGTNKSERGKE